MTAFRPGQSPPPVRTPTRTVEPDRLERGREVRVLPHAADASFADGDHRRVPADREVAPRLQRPVVGRVALLARDPEGHGDVVADPDATLDLDAVVVREPVGE